MQDRSRLALAFPSVRAIRPWLAIGVLVSLIATLLHAPVAHADIAPPKMPPGSNINPADETQVQMRAERIVITVSALQPASTNSMNLVGDYVHAQVDGWFQMRNTGKAAESMQVRFPLADPSGMGNGFGAYPEVLNFQAWVDGQIASSSVITLPNPQDERQPALRWAAFDVTFPVTRNVMISVSYSISPTGYVPEAQFAYVLSTGAGWKGPIGKVDIILRLPYPATAENVLLDDSIRGGRIVQGEVRWRWNNLEPTQKNDWYATIVVPYVWQGILAARKAVQQDPHGASLWLALSKAYVKAVPYKYVPEGGFNFMVLSFEAMGRAVELAPKSAQMHAEYAGLLWYYFQNYIIYEENDGVLEKRIKDELDTALKLDPDNNKAKALLLEMNQDIEHTRS
jgi:hypothetical protein